MHHQGVRHVQLLMSEDGLKFKILVMDRTADANQFCTITFRVEQPRKGPGPLPLRSMIPEQRKQK